MTEVLRVAGMAKRYGATIALDGVDLDVNAGEVHALIGENGAGKSTLMGILAGAVTPDRGGMQLMGSTYAPRTPFDARRAGVALIHQELSLCPHLTVAENVLLGREVAHGGWIDRRQSRNRAAELLAEMPHPEIHPDRRLGDLSLAARQIVEVCRALAADARVVLMDEPTSSLQAGDVDRLFALVRRLTDRGIAVIYISHFLEEVRRVADRFTVLRNGRSVAGGSMASATNDELIASMVGRSATELFPVRAGSARSDVALSVTGLASPPRLTSATFTVRRGEVLGIAGLLGSGRTELVRALFGLDRPAAGTIEIHGGTSGNATPATRLREGLGFVSEDRKGEGLALQLSITDNLCATRPALSHRGLGVIDSAAETSIARRWIQQLRVSARGPSQPVRALSGGNQQKVAIGRLLHQGADILLLDEPTRGVDIGSKADVYEIIAQRADEGCAILLVSSYLPELFGMCDRIAVMCRGRLSEARPTSAWTPEQVLSEAIGNVNNPDQTFVNTRRFGRLGWPVSEIGYGMWGMAGWTGSADERSRAALDEAVRLGCTFFDTAWGYGEGHSERLLGDLVRAHPETRLYTASKVPPKNRQWPSRRGMTLDEVFPPEYIEEYAQRTLANLGLPSIDLLQFHVWEDAWAHDDRWWRAMSSLRERGLIGGVGISVNRWEPANVLETLRTGHVDAVQVIYNVFDQAPEDELFPLCEELDIAVIARVPFDEGSLTGTMTRDTTFPDGDWRNLYFCAENLGQTIDHVEALRADVPPGMTMPELALRFILADDRVSTVIPGMRSLPHVASNTAASDDRKLSADTIAALRAHRWDRTPTEWSH